MDDNTGLPFAFNDYMELIDWNGKAIHPGKRGKINDQQPPILLHLGIDCQQFIRYLNREERGFGHLMDSDQPIYAEIKQLSCRFLKGLSVAE